MAKTQEPVARILSAVDGSPELAETLAQYMLYNGYFNMKEFTLRTFEHRFPELKPMIDWELRPKQGRRVRRAT